MSVADWSDEAVLYSGDMIDGANDLATEVVRLRGELRAWEDLPTVQTIELARRQRDAALTQVAALRSALLQMMARAVARTTTGAIDDAYLTASSAYEDSATAAAEHDDRVRAKALEEMAVWLETNSPDDLSAATWFARRIRNYADGPPRALATKEAP